MRSNRMNSNEKHRIRDPNDRHSFLKVDLILATIYRLHKRIEERFPHSGLLKVCKELIKEGEKNKENLQKLTGPIWWLRGLSIFAIIVVLSLVVVTIVQLTRQMEPGAEGWVEWIQVIESVVNELIFLAIALFFLISTEIRVKRSRTLKALHKLRNIAHVIDMHQLTKDPVYVLANAKPTASSPERSMSSFQLVRYLDYCTEMLSLCSKLSALYGQYINDGTILTAVNEMETLANSLSAKIWQKIMILDLAVTKEEE